MRSFRVLSATAALFAAALPGPARADTVVRGRVCHRADYGDPRPPEYAADTISAGPLALVDDATPPALLTGTVVCTVRSGWTHTGPVVASVESEPGTGVVYLPPTTVWYLDVETSLCTELRLDGGPTLFWDGDRREWTTDAAASCEPGPRIEPDPLTLADPLVCPILALLYPPEGDVPGIWDCPPYGNAR